MGFWSGSGGIVCSILWRGDFLIQPLVNNFLVIISIIAIFGFLQRIANIICQLVPTWKSPENKSLPFINLYCFDCSEIIVVLAEYKASLLQILSIEFEAAYSREN